MKKSKRLIIKGPVQSLFFEKFIMQQAQNLNLKGFLRKLEDGRIEVFIEGQGEDINQMTQITKRGPKHAQIRNVEERPEKFQGFSEFKILRI